MDIDTDSSLITGEALERYFELQDALFEFSRLFDKDEPNDRAIVIVGAAFLDTLLEHLLSAFLVDDEKEIERVLHYDQPLGTYSGRTTMAYCFGLINKTVRDDLRLVGKVRNEFAHNLYASFEDKRIKSWCSELKWHLISYVANPPCDATSRELFHVGVNRLVSYLHGYVGVARIEQRKIATDS
jgi:DNA-binding MltR family transcriptional regulator